MDYFALSCQVCLATFTKLCKLKKHLRSQEHRLKMKEVYNSDLFSGHGFVPYIAFVNSQSENLHKLPIIGLSMLTLCFSKKSSLEFYLCHVCEERCPPSTILSHLTHGDHCSNYYSYTDPNILSFSWIPNMNMRAILKPMLTKEVEKYGSGTLQVLELPENLLKKLETSTYPEVMHTLKENCKLNQLIEAVKPKRKLIQTYQRDSTRKHPLLGMQHLVECICDGPTEERYYLCMLCKLTVATHMIIKHVVSFDHIFAYFNAWHPSTLQPKECYTYYKSFASSILDFSKQTEEIYASANTEMKRVILNSAEFASVNFTCYAEALEKLELKASENEGSSLITSIKPGHKLECRSEPAGRSRLSYSIVLRCQLCSMIFVNISLYFKHLSKEKHTKMFRKSFCQALRGYEETGMECKPYLGLYRYLQDSSRNNQPVFGMSLIVTCINTQVQAETIYVCFACEESFTDSVLERHISCKKHITNTLLYQNPWRLPFGWDNNLDMKALKSEAWKEEEEGGPNQTIMMKILHLPSNIFWSLLPPTYPKVMKTLELHHTALKCAVPRRATYTKLKDNERFPLLGRRFMVLYDVEQNEHREVAFLCLLCKRTLSGVECAAHVFSREHVERFLECFHPGSLTLRTDAVTLLDLAKQAGRIHSISTFQVIKLDVPIREPCSYYKTINILAAAKRRYMQEPLEPPITPKMKLVPRETVKEMDKDRVSDNTQKNGSNQSATRSSITLLEDSDATTSQKSTGKIKMIAVKVDPKIACEHFVKSEKHGNEKAKNDTLTPSGKESEKREELFSETTLEEMKNTGNDTNQLIKEETIEEPTTRKPSGEMPARTQNTETDDSAKTEEEKIKISKDYMCKENGKKRPNSMSEKSPKGKSPDEDVGKETGHEMQQLTSKENAACEEPQNMPRNGPTQVTTADKGESDKPSHEDTKDKASYRTRHQSKHQLWQYIKKKSREPVVGLSALYECLCDQRDTIYLCECCSLMIPEENIISHVTGFHHWKMYLAGLQTLPPQLQCEEIRSLAETFESLNGYGNAQVIELDEEVYNKMLKEDFQSALQTVKSVETHQKSRSELPSTSSLFGVEPVDASVTLQTQHMIDNIQVVGMEINSDSEDPETQPSSVSATMTVMTEPTSKTTKACPESTNDVAIPHTKVPQSADHVDVCLTVSRSGENESPSLSLSLGAAPFLGSISKPNVSQHHNKDVPFDKCTTTTSSSTPAKSSCTTATKLSENNYKSTVTTSSAIATTAAKLNSGSTTTSTAPSSSCTTNITKSRETTNKCTTFTSSSTIAKSKRTAEMLKSSVTTSSVPATTTKLNSSIPTTSTALVSHCATSRSKCRETTESTVSLQTMATAKIAKSTTDAAPHVHMSSPPAMPPTEPSHTTMTKTKPNTSSPKVGVNQLIVVLCERRQQIYCQLCSVRLKGSNHVSSDEHRLNYEKMKFDKDVASRTLQKIEVKHDVYKKLAALPEHQAIEQLKAMITQKALLGISSPTTDGAESLRQTSFMNSASPNDIYLSPVDEINIQHNKMLGVSTNYQDRQNWADKGPEANDLKQGQLHSRPDMNINAPEPTPRPSIQEPDTTVTGEQKTLGPGHQSTQQELPSVSIVTGASTSGCSNLSIFLAVKNLDTKPILGLGSVWECQGISLDSFYLCECCRETLSVTDICQHMVSSAHQIRCMRTHYSQFLYFLEMDEVPPEEKHNILMDIAKMFSARECFNKMDAQVVTLTHKLYESVRTAPFSEALKMVQNIKKEHKLRVVCQPLEASHQKEARRKPENCNWKDTATVRDLDEVKRRKVVSLKDVRSVSTDADSTETHKSVSVQPDLRPTDSQQQRPVSDLQVKRAELHSESPSFSTVGHKTTQSPSMSSRDKYPQSRKRPAPASVETHTSKSQLKDPRQAKHVRSSLQVARQRSHESTPESTSVNRVDSCDLQHQRSIEVPHSVSTVRTADLSNTVAALRGYGQIGTAAPPADRAATALHMDEQYSA